MDELKRQNFNVQVVRTLTFLDNNGLFLSFSTKLQLGRVNQKFLVDSVKIGGFITSTSGTAPNGQYPIVCDYIYASALDINGNGYPNTVPLAVSGSGASSVDTVNHIFSDFQSQNKGGLIVESGILLNYGSLRIPGSQRGGSQTYIGSTRLQIIVSGFSLNS